MTGICAYCGNTTTGLLHPSLPNMDFKEREYLGNRSLCGFLVILFVSTKTVRSARPLGLKMGHVAAEQEVKETAVQAAH